MTEEKIKMKAPRRVHLRRYEDFFQHEHEEKGFTRAEKIWIFFVLVLLLECLREFINYSNSYLR